MVIRSHDVNVQCEGIIFMWPLKVTHYGTVDAFLNCSNNGRRQAAWTFLPHSTSIYVGGPCELALVF